MACATFLKLNAPSSQWIGQQSFTQRSGSSTRLASRRVSVPIRAGAYTDELVKTAVSLLLPQPSPPVQPLLPSNHACMLCVCVAIEYVNFVNMLIFICFDLSHFIEQKHW